MQVKVLQNAPREHSAILSTFIMLKFTFKTFVLSILSDICICINSVKLLLVLSIYEV